ncbi:hypothetical protein DSCOOX_07230 [Desulfosarcina ovata subsp. ovata]|uniref:Uncharacterized protein n=1 Tax=Desulfosarcina ovata subsp. ovata TaxID=2752305 RepID=A0A5K8A4N6_9BACT|nr:hypothetical protein DSCOOX_07230 [Desulfosarcina ovata subsp. ovata]
MRVCAITENDHEPKLCKLVNKKYVIIYLFSQFEWRGRTISLYDTEQQNRK